MTIPPPSGRVLLSGIAQWQIRVSVATFHLIETAVNACLPAYKNLATSSKLNVTKKNSHVGSLRRKGELPRYQSEEGKTTLHIANKPAIGKLLEFNT